MANIRDVAKKAGVGIGTVSRALNNSGYVSKDTLARIREAAAMVGYECNIPEPEEEHAKMGLVGVIVPSIDHPFFAKMMRCIEFELSRYDYRCLACNTIDITNRKLEFMNLLEEKHVDGLIAFTDPPPGFTGRGGRPIVCMDRKWSDDVPLVRSDHETGGQLAAEAFLRSGCRKVIQFCGGDRSRVSSIRHVVLENILREHGCDVVSVQMPWNHMSFSYSSRVIQDYWRIIADMDGCFSSDLGAMSCLAAAAEKGVKIPEQLRVIAYDGTELTSLCYPPLSAVEQDAPALARACVENLLVMMEGREPKRMLTKVPVIWRERGTT